MLKAYMRRRDGEKNLILLKKFDKLDTLDLSYNNIEFITVEIFTGLERL